MKQIKIAGAILVIVGALVWTWYGLHPQPPDNVAQPGVGLGQVLAQEAVDQLHGKTGHVVVVCMPTASVESQTSLESLQRTMAKYKNITLTMKLFAVNEVGIMDTIPFQRFANVVNQYAGADVIIFMLQPNVLTDTQIEQLPHPAPKLIVFRWNPEEVTRGMKWGLIMAAITDRRWSSLPSDHPRNPRQWFDRNFELITAESNMPTQN